MNYEQLEPWVRNYYSAPNNDILSEGDKQLQEFLKEELAIDYKDRPARAKKYVDDILNLYLWMKGRHPNIHEIAEGMNWSENKARAVLKLAKKYQIVRRYSRNKEEYQIVYRWDLTDEFKYLRHRLFKTPNPEFGNIEYTDIVDWLGNDFSIANQERIMNEAWDELGVPSLDVEWWREMDDKYCEREIDINGNIATPETPKKLLIRGSKYL